MRVRVHAAARPGPGGAALEPLPQTVDVAVKGGVVVRLVGAMHFNPHSIGVARAAVRSGGVTSVVLEQCHTRWERTKEAVPPGSVLARLLESEMGAAAEEAEGVGARLVLGDLDVDGVGELLKEAAKATLLDLVTPWTGGWQRVSRDVVLGADECFFRAGEAGLKLGDMLDARLVAGLPVSFVRYPVAALVKAPWVKSLQVLAFFAALFAAPALLLADSPDAEASWAQVGVAFGVDALQTVFFARVAVVSLLGERNVVLADAIREEAERSPDGSVVVAILGAAHCNGVAALLAPADES